MAKLKTVETTASVISFVNSIPDVNKRNDCFEIIKIMKQATNMEPKMWGKDIIGFGNYKYKYESGREGEWFLTGFSPRSLNISIYIMTGFNRYKELMKKLGNVKTGKSCLYVKKLEEIDKKILKDIILLSLKDLKTGKHFAGV